GICAADILRFLRLFRYGHGSGPHAGLQTAYQLQHALLCREHHRVLATLAHFAFELAAGLLVHTPGWQPSWALCYLSQFIPDHAPGWALARSKLDFRFLGSVSRVAAVHPPSDSRRARIVGRCSERVDWRSVALGAGRDGNLSRCLYWLGLFPGANVCRCR